MKFSVIIPSYNYGHLLPAALDSLKNQTYADWECLIIDNHSTDQTEAVCKTYLSDQRIKYFRLDRNEGPSPARNFGLGKAAGDYILFLDADDYIERDKLRSAGEILKQNAADAVFTDYAFFNEQLGIVQPIHSFTDKFRHGLIKSGNIFDTLMHGNIFAINTIIVSKKRLQELKAFDTVINYNEDWDLWLRFSAMDSMFYYDANESAKAMIREHTGSHSKDRFKMYLCGLYVCLKNFNLPGKNVKSVFKPKIRHHIAVLEEKLLELFATDQVKLKQALDTFSQMPLVNKELVLYRKLLTYNTPIPARLYVMFSRFTRSISRIWH